MVSSSYCSKIRVLIYKLRSKSKAAASLFKKFFYQTKGVQSFEDELNEFINAKIH